MMVWIMSRPIKKCCSVTILRPLLAQVRWSAGTGGADGPFAGDDLAAGGRRAGGSGAGLMVLFVSTRRDGRSLGELVKEEMGA